MLDTRKLLQTRIAGFLVALAAIATNGCRFVPSPVGAPGAQPRWVSAFPGSGGPTPGGGGIALPDPQPGIRAIDPNDPPAGTELQGDPTGGCSPLFGNCEGITGVDGGDSGSGGSSGYLRPSSQRDPSLTVNFLGTSHPKPTGQVFDTKAPAEE